MSHKYFEKKNISKHITIVSQIAIGEKLFQFHSMSFGTHVNVYISESVCNSKREKITDFNTAILRGKNSLKWKEQVKWKKKHFDRPRSILYCDNSKYLG